MKKLLLSSLLLSALSAAAWNVSTAPSAKSALIEEFTGFHCQNCPDGHRTAARLQAMHPDDVFVVAIHAGGFATPRGSEPDYRTALGETLNDHFGVDFYPAGVISRTPNAEGATVQGRNTWGPSARYVLQESSPVNLWSSSTYDAQSRTLTLTVEGYLTGQVTDLRLNAWLLQSEILGPQTGGQLGNEYPHRHMLRARLNEGDMGETVADAAQGQYFTRSYTYTLPADINGIAVNPANIQLLTFATEGEGPVLKATECRPSGAGCEDTFGASSALAPIGMTKNYALDYFEVMLQNHGGQPLTTADFDVKLNGSLKQISWQGEVPGYTSRLIRVSLDGAWDSALDNDTNTASWRLRRVNGNDIDNLTNSFSFGALFTYPAELTIKIKTDLDAADNTYRIIDRHGNTVKEFGPYENNKAAEYTEQVSLEPGQVYGLEIADAWGDGVRHPLGYVKLYDADGTLVAQIKEINDFGMRQFFRTQGNGSVGDTGADLSPAVYYDLNGRPAKADCPGVYIVKSGETTSKVIK